MRFSAMLGLLCTAGLATAQDLPPGALSTLAQTAENRTNEWSVLASNLEQRVARMLPCDTRVRSAIEEVSRASDARFAAIIAEWKEIAKKSSGQVEAAHKLIADSDARAVDWKADAADSEQEQLRVGTQTTDLREAARQQAALGTAAQALKDISEKIAAAVKQGASRQAASMKLSGDLNAFIAAAQTRQTAIDNQVNALTAESTRWSAYYAARAARAQMECAITAGVDDPATKPAKKGGR